MNIFKLLNETPSVTTNPSILARIVESKLAVSNNTTRVLETPCKPKHALKIGGNESVVVYNPIMEEVLRENRKDATLVGGQEKTCEKRTDATLVSGQETPCEKRICASCVAAWGSSGFSGGVKIEPCDEIYRELVLDESQENPTPEPSFWLGGGLSDDECLRLQQDILLGLPFPVRGRWLTYGNAPLCAYSTQLELMKRLLDSCASFSENDDDESLTVLCFGDRYRVVDNYTTCSIRRIVKRHFPSSVEEIVYGASDFRVRAFVIRSLGLGGVKDDSGVEFFYGKNPNSSDSGPVVNQSRDQVFPNASWVSKEFEHVGTGYKLMSTALATLEPLLILLKVGNSPIISILITAFEDILEFMGIYFPKVYKYSAVLNGKNLNSSSTVSSGDFVEIELHGVGGQRKPKKDKLEVAEKVKPKKLNQEEVKAVVNEMLAKRLKSVEVLGKGKYSFEKFLKQAGPVVKPLISAAVTRAAGAISGTGAYADFYNRGKYKVRGKGSYEMEPITGNSNHLVGGGQDWSPTDPGPITGTVGTVYAPGTPGAGAAVAANAFTIFRIPVNPGLMSFDSRQAQTHCNSTEYEILQGFMQCVPDITIGSTNTNGVVAKIAMVHCANPNEPTPTSYQQVIDYENSVKGLATEVITLPIECDPKKMTGSARRLIRFGPAPPNTDAKDYDWGVIFVAIFNSPYQVNGYPLADLNWSAHIRSFKKKLFSALGKAIAHDCFFGSKAGMAAATPYGTFQYSGQQNSIGIFFVLASALIGVFNIPTGYSGWLRVRVTVAGTGMSGTITPTVQGLVTFVSDLMGTSGPSQYLTVTQGNGSISLFDIFVPQAANGLVNSFTVTSGLAATTLTSFVVDVTQYNTDGTASNGWTNVVDSTGTLVSQGLY